MSTALDLSAPDLPNDFQFEVDESTLMHITSLPEIEAEFARLQTALDALMRKGYVVQRWTDHATLTTKFRCVKKKVCPNGRPADMDRTELNEQYAQVVKGWRLVERTKWGVIYADGLKKFLDATDWCEEFGVGTVRVAINRVLLSRLR